MSYHVVSYQSFSFGTFSLHIIISKWNPKSYSFEIIFINLIIKSILFHHTIIYIYICIYIYHVYISSFAHIIYTYTKCNALWRRMVGPFQLSQENWHLWDLMANFQTIWSAICLEHWELPIAPFYVDLPVRCQSNREDIVLKRMPLLLPHQLYHYLFDTCFIEQIFVSFGSHSVFFGKAFL